MGIFLDDRVVRLYTTKYIHVLCELLVSVNVKLAPGRRVMEFSRDDSGKCGVYSRHTVP